MPISNINNNSPWKDYMLTILILIVVSYFFYSGKMSGEQLSVQSVGDGMIGLLNAYLFIRFVSSEWIKKNRLVMLILIGLVSVFTSSAILFWIILGSIGLSWLVGKIRPVKK